MSEPSRPWLVVVNDAAGSRRQWFGTPQDAWRWAEEELGQPAGTWSKFTDPDEGWGSGGGAFLGKQMSVNVHRPTPGETCETCARPLADA